MLPVACYDVVVKDENVPAHLSSACSRIEMISYQFILQLETRYDIHDTSQVV